MTGDTNKLTIEQIEEWASKRADDCGRACRQFLDTMRENEHLRNELKYIEFSSHAVPTVYGGQEIPKQYQYIIEKEKNMLGDIAKSALSYKDSDNADI